jgi:dephospho-CoA kinase
MTIVIGLTGSIGTGKSMISNRFKELEIPVIDADVIAREVVEPGKIAHQKIVAVFGKAILLEDHTLDRPMLGGIVFQDKDKRRQLNDIVHPEIRKEMVRQRDEWIRKNVACIVLDIPLLFESGLTDFVDKVLVVSADANTQLSRLMSRDQLTVDEIKQRIASQIPVLEKEKLADAVIDNNGTMVESYQQLDDILRQWLIVIPQN